MEHPSSSQTPSFPIIDISALSAPSPNPTAHLLISQQITQASQQWGFLLLKNHPIPRSSITAMFALAHSFFSLPESQKEPWPIDAHNTGYIGSFKDRNKDDKMSMWFGGVPGSLTDSAALPPFWHGHVGEVEAFKHQCHGLIMQLLVCFALAMDLPDANFFADAHKEDVPDGHALRMLMYPARSSQPEGTRMQPHTDSGSVTLLFQDSPGLEVEGPTGEWVKAPCLEGHILVNLGDALCFWSGGRLKATKHRVTFEGVPHDRCRMSMAYFGTAGPETVLEPIGRERGAREGEMETYVANGFVLRPGITVGKYRAMIMKGIYGVEKSGSGNEVGANGVVVAS
jgi:isopenicillin N synthase-like dioxygenase